MTSTTLGCAPQLVIRVGVLFRARLGLVVVGHGGQGVEELRETVLVEAGGSISREPPHIDGLEFGEQCCQ